MNPLDAILAQIDSDPAPLTEYTVADALQGHQDEAVELPEADRKEARSDFVAFQFVGKLEGRSEWGTRFGPFATGTHADGSPFEIPPLSDVTAGAVQHWRMRASTLKNPVLAARYADLAWDLAKLAHVAAKKEDAELATDFYLQSTTASHRPDLHERLTAAVRAFDIAGQIKDAVRAATARTTILNLHQQTLTGKVGWWWIAPKRLLRDNRTGLSIAEEAALISSLESLTARFGDATNPTTFDPHQHESAADYLVTHYRRKGQDQDVKRLTEAVARAFEAAANLATPLLASTFLRKSADAFQTAGMKDEQSRVRIALESALKASKDEMTPIEVGSEIKADDMQEFVDRVVDENLGKTLARIGARFLRSRGSLEKALQKEAKAAPLQAMIEIEIIENDRVVGIVGPLKDDLLGRLVRASEMHSTFSDPWLMECLDRAIEVHDLHPTLLAAWINRHGLFDDARFLIQGLGAWLSQDDAAAIHLLVPQVESALRAIATSLSLPVTKHHPAVKKASVAINLGDMLANETIANALGPDITLYFRALYSDPRGKNLRNRIAHGLLSPNSLGPHVVRQVVHSLLVLAIWKELAARPRN